MDGGRDSLYHTFVKCILLGDRLGPYPSMVRSFKTEQLGSVSFEASFSGGTHEFMTESYEVRGWWWKQGGRVRDQRTRAPPPKAGASSPEKRG
eukprot:6177919-Pleurochrysis_carterae.AAC.1